MCLCCIFLVNFNEEKASQEEKNHYKQVVDSKVTYILKQKLYNWTSIDYTKHMSLVYLVARAVPEFVTLTRVFKELSLSSPGFEPKTLFDFGSGVGTVVW